MRVLKLFHCFDLTLHFLLHAELPNLVFVQDLESNLLTDSFIDSHYDSEVLPTL